MSSFPNLSVNWVLWSIVLGGHGISKHSVVNAGLWAAACGKSLALFQLGLGQMLSPWACSLPLPPPSVREMAPTSEGQKLLVMSTVIHQCILP